jgi:hypothetical protein
LIFFIFVFTSIIDLFDLIFLVLISCLANCLFLSFQPTSIFVSFLIKLNYFVQCVQIFLGKEHGGAPVALARSLIWPGSSDACTDSAMTWTRHSSGCKQRVAAGRGLWSTGGRVAAAQWEISAN